MHLKQILLIIEGKTKDIIKPESKFAFSLNLSDLCNEEALKDHELRSEIASLKDPEIIAPMKNIPGVHSYIQYTPNHFINGIFSDYVQLNSGLIVPSSVAEITRLPFKAYRPTENIGVTSGLDFCLDDIVIF